MFDILPGIALKSTILLAAASSIAWLLRDKPARFRMMLWRATAAALLVLAPLSVILSRSEMPRIAVLPQAFVITSNAATAASHGTYTLPWMLTALWMTGLGALMLRIAAGHFLIWNALRADTRGAVVKSQRVRGPVAWGIWKPRVLLPAESREWKKHHRKIVLAHEIAHIRGNDCFWLFLSQVSAALYWFHPLAWFAVARLREETEFHCDDVLLARGFKPSAYAETLLAFAGASSHFDRLCPVTVAVARRTSIGRRIQRILTMQPTHRITSAGTVLAIFAFLLVFPIAAMQSSKADKVSNEKVERVGNGVKPPVPIQKQAPIYTQQAKDDKIQGKVKLDVIIGEDGAVKEVTVIQALDPGLDENAVSAVKNWRFEPATKDGKPVAVKSTIEINFTLK